MSIHRFGFRATAEQRRALESLRLELSAARMPASGAGDPLLVFDIADDHPQWSRVLTLMREWAVPETHVSTWFTKQEIEAASWLELVPDWHQGYPLSDEDKLGYRATTYDLEHWCERCGAGMTQAAWFRMKGEPKWGRNAILQLNWVFDEYFVTPDAWSTVFEPAGIGCRPVLSPCGAELKTVVQLVIENSVDIATKGLASERCTWCGRVKYLSDTRRPFPVLLQEPTSPMVRTVEYFGSGSRAYNAILVSRQIAWRLAAARIHGASLRPVVSW